MMRMDDDDKARAISVSLTGSGRVGSGPVESGRVGSGPLAMASRRFI